MLPDFYIDIKLILPYFFMAIVLLHIGLKAGQNTVALRVFNSLKIIGSYPFFSV
jgi:hypothetical protein